VNTSKATRDDCTCPIDIVDLPVDPRCPLHADLTVTVMPQFPCPPGCSHWSHDAEADL
jgi:hypothetical protein